jgi:hypothetical protein
MTKRGRSPSQTLEAMKQATKGSLLTRALDEASGAPLHWGLIYT